MWILGLFLTGYGQNIWVRGPSSTHEFRIEKFGILTTKHGNKFKHENEAEGHGPSASVSCLSLFPHLLVKIQKGLF